MALTLKEISQKVAQNAKLVIVEDYEIGVEETIIESETLAAGKSTSTSVQKEWLITLRLIHRKRLGESFVTSTDFDSLNLLVEHAIRSAEASLPCPWFRFPLWRAMGKEAPTSQTSSLKSADIAVSEGTVVTVAREQKQKRIQRKTEKLVQEQKFSNVYVEIIAPVLVNGSEKILRDKIKNPDSADRVSKLVKKLASQRKYFTEAPLFSLTDKHQLVFSDSISSGILERLSSFFAADNTTAESYWNTQKRILPSHVLIVDDGKKNALTGEFFDFEGVAGQKVVVVSEGKLQSMLHNTTTGAKYNRPGTGSLRVFENAKGPKISFSNLYLEKGSKKIEELIHKIKDGVFLETATQWEIYQRDGAEFIRFDALGWRIERGEGTHPVFCSAISFPLVKFLECIDELSDQVEWHGSVASPAVTVQHLLS